MSFRQHSRSIIMCAIVALIFATAAVPSARADCQLERAAERHQRFDNFLEQKFDHVWYGTEPSSDYRPLPITQVIHRLPPRTAVLFYELSTEIDFVHPNHPTVTRVPPQSMCAWLFDREDRVVQVETPLDEPDRSGILTLADDVRISLADNDDLRGWRAPDQSRLVLAGFAASLVREPPGVVLARASRLLLPPSIREAIQARTYERLVIVPSRNFGDIPYAALPVDGGAPLIDFVSIAVVPSFTSLSPLSMSGRPAGLENGLIVGDPELVHPDKLVRRGMFGPLPGARDEARQVAQVLGLKPLIGAAATKSAVLTGVGDSGLIYLATHGVANDTDPNDRSYLVLSDGALTARQIAKLRLYHPIVVMSACQTGLGKTFESGVIGLAKAWKFAGASTVVMSLWSVYDDPTRNLMVEFITLLKGGEPPDLALRAAMRKLKENPNYAHPAYWAGFMIYGTL